MRTSNAIANEVRNYLALLLNIGMAVQVNPTVTVSDGSLNKITWRSKSGSGFPVTFGEFASINEYKKLVEAESYSAFLFDGALLQITFFSDGHGIVRHRLVYFPCPFDMDAELVREEPVLDVVQFYIDQGLQFVRMRSPMRFDFDPENSGPNHPVSHVHFQDENCRMAIVSPLSLGHFNRLIFFHFYPSKWRALKCLRLVPLHESARTITLVEETIHHLAIRPCVP